MHTIHWKIIHVAWISRKIKYKGLKRWICLHSLQNVIDKLEKKVIVGKPNHLHGTSCILPPMLQWLHHMENWWQCKNSKWTCGHTSQGVWLVGCTTCFSWKLNCWRCFHLPLNPIPSPLLFQQPSCICLTFGPKGWMIGFSTTYE